MANDEARREQILEQYQARKESSGSSVPEAARAAARVSVANVVNDSWPLSGDQQIAVDVALMAAIPFIVAAAVAEERARVRQGQPPDGWLQMGTCVDWPWLTLEFSEELDDCGLPLWERPVDSSAEERATTGRRAWDEGFAAGEQMARWWGHVDSWEEPYPENPYAVRAALASPGEGE